MAKLSILIPHKHDAANDRALRIAIECIIDNTRADYELLIDTTTPADPYDVINKMVRRASADYLVFSNSDVFFAPDWDVPLLASADYFTIVCGVLVESGAIGVNPMNVKQDFGMSPQHFNRAAFETWAKARTEMPAGDGWYFPCLINKEAFIAAGGFDLSRGFFPKDSLDEIFWLAWRAAGHKVQRVASYAYHLQNYSNPSEQQKGVRQ